MTSSIEQQNLPPIPDSIYDWDGDCAINCVFARWRQPDLWESPDQPILYLYQAVIGDPIYPGQLALDLAAEYLINLGWTTTRQDGDKDWYWYHLTPPAILAAAGDSQESE